MKKYKNGFITNPACLSPDHTVSDVLALKEKYGFSGVPITHTGRLGGVLLGMVCSRDLDFLQDRSVPLRDVMTVNLITGATLCDPTRCMWSVAHAMGVPYFDGVVCSA